MRSWGGADRGDCAHVSTAPQLLPWQLSAAQLIAAYERGECTPTEVLEATLARLEEVNPRLNAVITLDAAGARAAAAESATRWRGKQWRGALDGVPVTIKDSLLARGLRATWGSRAYSDHVPDHDELPVARLREAGAVILGKTNVPEFTVQGYTDNLLFGPTRNPWNSALTPGGSSGGAVAAVAAGIGALALGTDGGGSIRRPASHAGLIGFKPSRGAVPRPDGFPAILFDFEVAGPIARCVEDIISAMRVIGSAKAASALAMHEPPTRCRILFAPTFADAPVDPEIAASVALAARELERQGHHVEETPRFDLAEPLGDVWPVITQTGVAWLLSRHQGWKEKVGSAAAAMAEAGAKLSAADYLDALDRVARVRRDIETLFERYDLVLTPTTAALPWPATEVYPRTIAGRQVGPRGHAIFTPLANAAGLPAISLPCAPSASGLPIGFQLVGAMGRDALVLAVAHEHEKATGLRVKWPDIKSISS
jgi:aspartyl-tRNA(Asn)/glutamyl-tRNA(Gln) amidotransferase subunit A